MPVLMERIVTRVCLKKRRYGKGCKETLNIPPPRALPDIEGELPYVFVGDEAFALHNNLLRPYGSQELDHIKRIFN